MINEPHRKVLELAIDPNMTTINQHFLINIRVYLFLDLNQHNHVQVMPIPMIEFLVKTKHICDEYKLLHQI
jgi:hypothetical protein